MTFTRNTRWFALALVASLMLLARPSAQAQSTGDYWKSAAIIGGSTAAGAYIGHKVGGTAGTVIGAGVGASAGYAIDRRRRQSQYNNNPYASNDPAAQYSPYGNTDPYGQGGYSPYPANGGYNGPYNNGPYAGGPSNGQGGYGPYGNAGPYGSPYPGPYGFQSRTSATANSRSFTRRPR